MAIVTNVGVGCGGRDSVGAQGRSQGGLNLVSDVQARKTNDVKARRSLLAKTGCCVRQNRVVPTPVAGVKLSVAKSIQPDRVGHQAGSDGDKTNTSPG